MLIHSYHALPPSRCSLQIFRISASTACSFPLPAAHCTECHSQPASQRPASPAELPADLQLLASHHVPVAEKGSHAEALPVCFTKHCW